MIANPNLTTNNLLFLTIIAFFLVHELDAIRQHEWQFFFALTPFSDENGYRLFTAAHAPLFVVMLSNLHVAGFQTGFDGFMILHAVTHWLLRRHPKISFNTWFSRLWIFGGAFLGLLHLALSR